MSGDEELTPQEKEALDFSLRMEKETHPEETNEKLTMRLLEENLPRVAMNVIQLALNGGTERIRLEASRVVMDRVMGPVGKAAPVDGPLEAMVRMMQDDAESHANRG